MSDNTYVDVGNLAPDEGLQLIKSVAKRISESANDAINKYHESEANRECYDECEFCDNNADLKWALESSEPLRNFVQAWNDWLCSTRGSIVEEERARKKLYLEWRKIRPTPPWEDEDK